MRKTVRWTKVASALFLLLVVILGAEDALPISDPVERTARPYVFDLVSWEAGAALGRVPQLAGWFWSLGATADAEAEERQVLDYFVLARAIREAESNLRRLQASGGSTTAVAAAQSRLDGLHSRREGMEAGVEALISRHAAEELRGEGLTTGLGPFRPLFPPVEFELTRTPTVLVVSPRERIRLQHSIILRPNVSPQEVERIERTIEAQGLSTVVEPTGGFSTYPAMIPETAALDFALSTIVHEWLHAYLFFRPLGWNYFASNEMRSINETVADIAGNEIGSRLAGRYRRHLLPPSPPPAPAPESGQAPRQDAPPPFDFRKEMRETRLEADRLLAAGRIEEAEQYMEARRKVFVANGYIIRKLNQAYFAFHGTYGDSPASVSPIFGYLKSLRERSGSLSEFLRTVAQIKKYDDLLALVGVTGGGDGAAPTSRRQ